MMRHASNDDDNDDGGGDGEYCNDYYKKLLMITDIDKYICRYREIYIHTYIDVCNIQKTQNPINKEFHKSIW